MTEELVRCLEAVTLRCGKWTAQVSPRYGMNTLALCWNGRAVLRSPESLEEFLRLPEGYGTPPLLPANRTKDGTFEFEGRKYTLPINDRFHTHKHGYVHTSAFTVTSRSESAVEGILENHGALYPFPFRMTVCTALEEDGLHQDYTLTNIGKSDMPVIFAIHASFVAPEKCRIPVEKVWLADERCLPTMELGPLPEELKPYTVGEIRSDMPVGYCCPAVGLAAELDDMMYEVSPQFTQWIIWNGNGREGFLCVEPQTAPSNVLCRTGEAMVVWPGESVVFSARIYRN